MNSEMNCGKLVMKYGTIIFDRILHRIVKNKQQTPY